MALWFVGLPALRTRWFVVCSIVWLCFGMVQVEEWRSVLRGVLPTEEVESSLRITSVNCSGSMFSVRDAMIEVPDVLLIQESPPLHALSGFLIEHTEYQLLFGLDRSILVRGGIREAHRKQFYTMGSAVIDGQDYCIVSLRLLTSNPRVDLWKADCWKAQVYNRQRQIQQLTEIVGLLPDDVALIVGGDFNVPQRDGIFDQMNDRLEDSFVSGGRGWCNTVLVDFPMLRIDQVWTSRTLSCFDASVRKSPKTDHLLYTARFAFVDL